MLMLFGRNGSINLLLDQWFGFTIPFMEGLNGVIFVESVHYFPFILINISAALQNIDRAMEESAQNLGCSGLRLFRRIVLPLAMPGYVAGASLVFLKVFDDLGTPLLLNVNNMLAPHFGLTLLSFGTIWSFSALPDAFTVDHFVAIFAETPEYMTNTVLYSFLAGIIDVILGTAIAYIVLRTKLIGRQWLYYIAMAAVAIPGLVIGIGYLRTFFGYQVPWLENQPIVIEPQVLLLDEPLSNLDAKLRVQMRRELRQLQRKLSLTTIFVTHDQEEANTTADRIAVINDGIVQQIGTPMELYDRPANLFVANFLGVANVVEGTMQADNGKVVFHASDGSVIVPMLQGNQGPGSIVFRPQNLTIQNQDAGPLPGTTQLTGSVEHKEFLGGVVRYSVAVGGHFILVDSPHQRGEEAMPEGTPVVLCLSSNQVIGITS